MNEYSEHRQRWLEYRLRAATIASRLWSVNPAEITSISPPITREQFYEKHILQLVDDIFQDERLFNELSSKSA